jgi:hypothetical protein
VAAVSWWLWVLIWVALCLGALGFLFLLLRGVWRKLRLLFTELGVASDRLSAVTEELERLQERTPATADPAVFDKPNDLRAQRFAARTKRERSAHRTRT